MYKLLIKLTGIVLISVNLNANDISLFKTSKFVLNYVSIENNSKGLINITIDENKIKLISGSSVGISCSKNEIVSFHSMMYSNNESNMIDVECGNKILITENNYEN